MDIILKDQQTTLDILDTDALTAYIREHLQVITAHTEECKESAGICISIVAPPFIQFFDAIHNRVNIVIDIEKPPKPRKTPQKAEFVKHTLYELRNPANTAHVAKATG